MKIWSVKDFSLACAVMVADGCFTDIIHSFVHPNETLTGARKHDAAPEVAGVNITVPGAARCLC